jgi:hypothetical protein
MSKNNSRLRKIEESLNVDNIEPLFVVMIGWSVSDCKKYFTNDDEIEKYKEWRINTIKLEYKQRGIPVPMLSFLFNTEDVEKHIDEFHKISSSLIVHEQTGSIELPEVIARKNGFDMTNESGKIDGQI